MGIWNVGKGERKSSPSIGSFSMCYNASCKNPVPINQPKSSLTSAAPFDWDVVGPENPVPHSLAKDREYPRIAQAYAVYVSQVFALVSLAMGLLVCLARPARLAQRPKLR